MNYRAELEPQPNNHIPSPEQIEPDQRVLTLQDPTASPQDQEAAFAEIYKEFFMPLHRRAMGMTKSHELAEEAVQESLLKAWRKIGQFDATAQGTSLSKWLYTITNNTTKNILTRGENKRAGDQPYDDIPEIHHNGRTSSDSDPLDHLIFIEEISVVSSLSDIVRETLAWDRTKTYEQLAEENGLTVSAVKARLVRAREASQKARTELGLTEAEKKTIKSEKAKRREERRRTTLETHRLEREQEELAVAA